MRYIILNIDVAFILLMFGIIYKGFIIVTTFYNYNYGFKYKMYGETLQGIGVVTSIVLGTILIALTFGCFVCKTCS